MVLGSSHEGASPCTHDLQPFYHYVLLERPLLCTILEGVQRWSYVRAITTQAFITL